MRVEYKTGSVLDQKGIIAHACNTEGVMGSGVALFLARKWPRAEEVYLKSVEDFKFEEGNAYRRKILGTISAVELPGDVLVVNMVTQLLCSSGAAGFFNGAPTSLDAVMGCLKELKQVWLLQSTPKYQPVIHMPLICAVRGGVSWNITKALIADVFGDTQAVVNVWLLPNERPKFEAEHPDWFV